MQLYLDNWRFNGSGYSYTIIFYPQTIDTSSLISHHDSSLTPTKQMYKNLTFETQHNIVFKKMEHIIHLKTLTLTWICYGRIRLGKQHRESYHKTRIWFTRQGDSP